MNKFGKLKLITLLLAIILFNISNTAFSSDVSSIIISIESPTESPTESTYKFKVNGHEYNVIKNGFKCIPNSSLSLNRKDLSDYLNSRGADCLKELKRLICFQDGKDESYFVNLLLDLKQHILLHGHMGYYPIFSSREGIISSLHPRGIFNINLECKKRIAFDQYRKLSDILITLQRDRDQSSIVDLPNLLPLSVTARFSLSAVPKGYSSLDPLFKNGSINTDLMPRPSLGAKSLEQIAGEIINWIFMQSVTTPIFADDFSDKTKFSIKATLPIAAIGTDLIPDVISGEHIGNVKIRGAGYTNVDNILMGVQVRDDGRIIITSLYPIE